MAAALKFPADPALRRQLWRQWVHLDPPRNSVKATTLRRVREAPASKPEDWARATIEATPGVVEGLRTAIAAAVVNGQLSNADRHRLIARGVRLGLSRFDASLLVAAVQHDAAERCDYRVVREWKQKPMKRPRSIATLVGATVALEAAGITMLIAWLGH